MWSAHCAKTHSDGNIFFDDRRHVIAGGLELARASEILVGAFELKPQPRAAFLKIQSVDLIAPFHGAGVSGYEQRHANNSELHCRTHPRTLAVAPI